MRRAALGAAAVALMTAPALRAQAQRHENDIVLKAMLDEMERSRALRVTDLDRPYYFEYSLEDADMYSVSAMLGGVISKSHVQARIPRVEVRVGDYDFDNTNHVYSMYYRGARLDPEPWPLDNNYQALRQSLWLATDRAFKMAVEAIARKRASLRNAASPEKLPDFSRVEPVRSIERVTIEPFPFDSWVDRIRKLSAMFSAYPEIDLSGVELSVMQGIWRFVTSEGAVLRTLDTLGQVRVRAEAQAADGEVIREAMVLPVLDLHAMASDADLERSVKEVAGDIRALLKAPLGESYSGPVLVESRAAAQLFAQLIGDNLRLPRKPVADPGRPAPFLSSEFESKLGARVLPDWMDVIDDPTESEWRGRKLIGRYPFDMEGVPPKPLLAVEKGVLKGYLMTRQPAAGVSGSNGRARLSGPYGADAAAISNLFIKASQTISGAELKQKLIETIKQRNKPYGMLIRKLDYPSAASMREIRSLAAAAMQGGGRAVSPPVLAYRVYADGREELVRGLRFRGASARLLRDVIAASDDYSVFDFVNNGAPLAALGIGGYVAPASVIAPAVLFEDMDLYYPNDEQPKRPLVPPPPMGN
jgi:TldD protein